ncbi:hypothetical protein [uncultured Sphingomonas sp.]|nr:hypothetical protein [uncultured Sphingomonas sp.]
MSKLTPVVALALCWFIGIIFGKPGLWFPLGILAAITIAIVQNRRGSSGS